MMIITAI